MKEKPSHKEPRWLTTRAGRAEKLEHIRMVERLPYLHFSQEGLAWYRFVEHFDRDRVFAPRTPEHLAERPKADPLPDIDLERRDCPAREVEVRTLRQPPQRIKPCRHEFAVKRIPAAVCRAGVTRFKRRAVIISWVFEGALERPGGIGHLAGRDLEDLNYSIVISRCSRGAHELVKVRYVMGAVLRVLLGAHGAQRTTHALCVCRERLEGCRVQGEMSGWRAAKDVRERFEHFVVGFDKPQHTDLDRGLSKQRSTSVSVPKNGPLSST
jgi:hypothetical protein